MIELSCLSLSRLMNERTRLEEEWSGERTKIQEEFQVKIDSLNKTIDESNEQITVGVTCKTLKSSRDKEPDS